MVQDSSPRGRISAAAQRCGEGLLVQRCIDLLSGRNPVPEAALLDVLGGSSARTVMAGHEGGVDGHWPRVWALRAFLYVWDPRAEHEVAAAGGEGPGGEESDVGGVGAPSASPSDRLARAGQGSSRTSTSGRQSRELLRAAGAQLWSLADIMCIIGD